MARPRATTAGRSRPKERRGSTEHRRDWRDWVETASRLAPLILKVWDLIDRIDGDR